MRITFIALCLTLTATSVVSAAEKDSLPVTDPPSPPAMLQPAANEKSPPAQKLSVPFKTEHPGDTALSQENGKWRIKSFPGLATLYVSDRDRPGKSNCNFGCDSAWPPLLVTEKPLKRRIGDWTMIEREDGRKQWAYKGRPVYQRYHDIPDDDVDIAREGFHRLEP